MATINELRIQALNSLKSLMLNLPSKFTWEDEQIDNVLRVFSKQPNRPAHRKPYLGLFKDSPVKNLRLQAFDLITKNSKFAGPNSDFDKQIDSLLRVLFRLPKESIYYNGIPLSFKPLTEDDLLKIAIYADPNQIERLLPFINQTLVEFSIITPLEKAHFLSQAAHESTDFNDLEEIASGSDYEGRPDLGNIHKGDGVRFKGRGLFMGTGRGFYEDLTEDFGVDFVSNPKMLSEDEYAARSAGWFWNREDLNELANEDNFDKITRIINGGTNGYDDRLLKLKRAKKLFKI